MAASNREAELEAMQFADTDSETEEIGPRRSPRLGSRGSTSRAEPMEVDEPTPTPGAPDHQPPPTQALGFRARKPSKIPLKWDLSIVACPYRVPTSLPTIFQNLPTWLEVQHNVVKLASLDWITSSGGSRHCVPSNSAKR